VDPSSREASRGTSSGSARWTARSTWTAVRIRRRTRRTPGRAFSTGEWLGETLRVRVTHVKEEYLKRNGVWHSDEIELTQYLIRRGDILTFLVIAYDPVYLTEPLIRSTEYRRAPAYQLPPYPVHGGHRGRSACRASCRITCRAPTTTSTGSRAATRFR
jgi:hypothetical protein